MSQRSGNAPWSNLQVIEIDASKFVPRKITDPKELERLRKRRADLKMRNGLKPKAADSKPADAPPDADATSPPTPS